MLQLMNLFSGPLGGLIEKGILSGVMFGVGKGYIEPASAGGIAAAIYTIGSAAFTAITRTQTAKIQAVNSADNGVKVVNGNQARGIPAATAPIPAPVGSRD